MITPLTALPPRGVARPADSPAAFRKRGSRISGAAKKVCSLPPPGFPATAQTVPTFWRARSREGTNDSLAPRLVERVLWLPLRVALPPGCVQLDLCGSRNAGVPTTSMTRSLSTRPHCELDYQGAARGSQEESPPFTHTSCAGHQVIFRCGAP